MPKSKIPAKYSQLPAIAATRKARRPNSHKRSPTSYDQLNNRKWRQRHDQIGHPPRVTHATLERIVQEATGESQLKSKRLVRVIVEQMIAAVRNSAGHDHIALRDLGTFRKRRHHYGTKWKKDLWGTTIMFDPHKSWYARWMPVLAYNEAGYPVGIYNGPQQILPWGHPDNPYPTADAVPLEPERYWEKATPLPGANSKKPHRAPEWDITGDPPRDPPRTARGDPHLTEITVRPDTRKRNQT